VFTAFCFATAAVLAFAAGHPAPAGAFAFLALSVWASARREAEGLDGEDAIAL
jgi:hypothetical protein